MCIRDSNNVVALRGDAIKTETYFTPTTHGHSYASELVNQISDLNKGKYLEELEISSNTNFCIGVAGYPEKHMEAPNLESDIHFLKQKIFDLHPQYQFDSLFQL